MSFRAGGLTPASVSVKRQGVVSQLPTVSARAPRFLLDARRPAAGRRLGVVAALGIVAVFVSASAVNQGTWQLLCEGGARVPYRGRFAPAGALRVDDPRYPALPIPDGTVCEDQSFATRGGFEKRYVELTVGRADTVVVTGDSVEDLQDAADAMEAVSSLPAAATQAFTERQRAVMEALLEAAVEQATEARRLALERLERARRAGVPPDVLRAQARRLGLTDPSNPAKPSEPTPPEPTEPPTVIEPAEPMDLGGGSRAL